MITFAGLGARNRDVKGEGNQEMLRNAPAADVALKGLSEGLTCEDCKGPLKDAAPELRHFALTDSWYLHVFPVFSYNFPFLQVFLFLKTGTKNLLQPLAGVKAIKYTV